jgi:peptidoglycan/LPS O-acetylase OafA/YrhL
MVARRILWPVTIKPDYEVDFDRLPAVRRLRTDGSGRPETTREKSGTLPVGWAVFAGLVGPVVAVFCMAVEPPPADPNAPEPLVATLLGFALMVAWGGAAVSAARRRATALTWAGFVGGLSMAMTISCPLSGHHSSIGMWWISQFIVCGAACAATVVGKHSIDGQRTEA